MKYTYIGIQAERSSPFKIIFCQQWSILNDVSLNLNLTHLYYNNPLDIYFAAEHYPFSTF